MTGGCGPGTPSAPTTCPWKEEGPKQDPEYRSYPTAPHPTLRDSRAQRRTQELTQSGLDSLARGKHLRAGVPSSA